VFDPGLVPRLPQPGELGPATIAATDQIRAKVRDFWEENPAC
jgi:hypothetical protein